MGLGEFVAVADTQVMASQSLLTLDSSISYLVIVHKQVVADTQVLAS